MGHVLSVVGALLLIGGLFLSWFKIDRANGFVEDATGSDTFTSLRLLILVGAVVLLLNAIVAQTQAVLIVRTFIGVVLGVLILLGIVFPPYLADPVEAQFGMFVWLLGAICGVFRGIADSSRAVADRYPEVAGPRTRRGRTA